MCKNSKSVYHLSEQVFTICPAYTAPRAPPNVPTTFKLKQRVERSPLRISFLPHHTIFSRKISKSNTQFPRQEK
jgi:hypothetical protein